MPERVCGPTCKHFRENGIGECDGKCAAHPPATVVHHHKMIPDFPSVKSGCPACEEWAPAGPPPA